MSWGSVVKKSFFRASPSPGSTCLDSPSGHPSPRCHPRHEAQLPFSLQKGSADPRKPCPSITVLGILREPGHLVLGQRHLVHQKVLDPAILPVCTATLWFLSNLFGVSLPRLSIIGFPLCICAKLAFFLPYFQSVPSPRWTFSNSGQTLSNTAQEPRASFQLSKQYIIYPWSPTSSPSSNMLCSMRNKHWGLLLFLQQWLWLFTTPTLPS